jgi:hypothetical protein
VISRRDQIEAELTRLNVTRDTTGSANTNPVSKPPVTNPVTNPVVTNPPVTNPPVNKPKDTVATKPNVINNQPPVKKDSVAVNQPITHSTYTFDPNQEHFIGVVLNKIDPVFVNEAKNAYARYNRDSYPGRSISISMVDLDKDNKMIVMGPLPTGYQAAAYVDAAKPRTASEILPWLRGGKYSYLIFSEANLQLLKNNKDIEGYRTFLNIYMPGKF